MSTFDPVLHWHHREFMIKCRELVGNAFQGFFESIMERAEPDFERVGAHGRSGDLKCDGFVPSRGALYQVFGADVASEKRLRRKITDDLAGAVEKWGEKLKEWHFVYNVCRNTPAPVTKHLTTQRTKYPHLTIKAVLENDLWKLVRDRLTPEERIEILGPPVDLGPYKPSGRILIVHDAMTPIDLGAALDAVGRDVAMGTPVKIWERGKAPGWEEASEYQSIAITELLDAGHARFAVFSLSPIPLAIQLGFILSDRADVICFQHHRDADDKWKWPDVEPDLAFIDTAGLPDAVVSGPREVVLRVSLSARISSDDTREAVRSVDAIEIDIAVANPGVIWLQHPAQVTELVRRVREALSFVRERVPKCPLIHLFYAGPTPGAVAIGQAINPRMNPPVALYEFAFQNSPRYERALTLRGD